MWNRPQSPDLMAAARKLIAGRDQSPGLMAAEGASGLTR
jgi:hypothetical protein